MGHFSNLIWLDIDWIFHDSTINMFHGIGKVIPIAAKSFCTIAR